MQRIAPLTALAAVVLLLAVAPPAAAQAQQQPETRIVTVTTFEVPFTERSKVMPFLREFFLPATQLNPNVLNFRVLTHNWGANAAAIVIVAEYASFADIESECGQPCDDYFAEHPEPEQGTPERAQFEERLAAFQKYYSNHRDEIYTTNMAVAKVEGELRGPVGPPPGPGN